MKIKSLMIRLNSILMQCKTKGNDIPLNYCIENNAGDSFNVDFLSDFFNKSVSKYTFGRKEHFLFCGSIASRSNKYSTIIGAGLMSESDEINSFSNIIGCRGRLTLEKIKNKYPNASPVFLGDPGLLVREVLPVIERKKNMGLSDKIGVIPHFVDYEIVKGIVGTHDKFKLIDIKRSYLDVCSDILSCDIILSSSLHGLIFSDALYVKNNWVEFSKKINGNHFKFNDYYSVMTNKKEAPIVCKLISDLECAAKDAKCSDNSSYDLMYKTISEVFSKK